MNAAMYRRRRGLTLIEVLLVIVILGILGGVAVFVGFGLLGTSQKDLAQIKMDGIEDALNTYRTTMGSYPTTEQGLDALVTRPEFEDEALGEKWTQLIEDYKDPWGTDYAYELVEGDGGTSVRLVSAGPDKTMDTDDDITNVETEE